MFISAKISPNNLGERVSATSGGGPTLTYKALAPNGMNAVGLQLRTQQCGPDTHC